MTRRPHNAQTFLVCLFASLSFALVGCGESDAALVGDFEAEETGENLSGAQREIFYHGSGGGEFMPYFALRALEVEVNGEVVSFMSQASLARFGFIADPPNEANPEGLPVGLTLALPPDIGVTSLGINCAACHVAEMSFDDGKGGAVVRRFDGAPSTVDVVGFFYGMAQALKDNLGGSPVRKAQFLERVVREARECAARLGDSDDSLLEQADILMTLYGVSVGLDPGNQGADFLINLLNISDDRKRLLKARYLSLRSLFRSYEARAEDATPGPGRADAFGQVKNQFFWGLEGGRHPQIAPPSSI